MNQSSILNISLVILFLLTCTVSKAVIIPVKALNKYGAYTATTSAFVNKYGAIGSYGVNSNGKEIYTVPLLAATTSVTYRYN